MLNIYRSSCKYCCYLCLFASYRTASLIIISFLYNVFQCASAVDNLATFYFECITAGESPTSPAALKLAQHFSDCPNIFLEVGSLFFVFFFVPIYMHSALCIAFLWSAHQNLCYFWLKSFLYFQWRNSLGSYVVLQQSYFLVYSALYTMQHNMIIFVLCALQRILTL